VEAIAQQLGLKTSLYRDRDETNLWQRLQKSMRIPSSESAITCKIGVMPNTATTTLEQLDRLTANQGLGTINLGSGLGRLHFHEVEIKQVQKMRSLCQKNQGFLTILEAPIFVKQQLEPWGYMGNALEIMRRVKQKFDPNNILNTGRFVGGI
jgi:glycolate oxidase FAD binding subunit